MKGVSIGLWLVAGIAGAIVFWLFQSATGPWTITAFMGQRIVTQGGYALPNPFLPRIHGRSPLGGEFI